MSKFKELEGVYKDYHTKTSKSVKENAFAGLAVLWVTSRPASDSTTQFSSISCFYLLAAMFFIMALALDLANNFFGSIWMKNHIDDIYEKYKELGVPESEDFEYPKKTIDRILFIYKAKVATIIIATVFLICALISSL